MDINILITSDAAKKFPQSLPWALEPKSTNGAGTGLLKALAVMLISSGLNTTAEPSMSENSFIIPKTNLVSLSTMIPDIPWLK